MTWQFRGQVLLCGLSGCIGGLWLGERHTTVHKDSEARVGDSVGVDSTRCGRGCCCTQESGQYWECGEVHVDCLVRNFWEGAMSCEELMFVDDIFLRDISFSYSRIQIRVLQYRIIQCCYSKSWQGYRLPPSYPLNWVISADHKQWLYDTRSREDCQQKPKEG